MQYSDCDMCKKKMEGPTEHLMILHHGALTLDIKVGIGQVYKGDICPDCIKQQLALVAEKGIFVGRKITLPEDIKPVLEGQEFKKSWLIR